MIQVVKGYKGSTLSNRTTWDRKQSYESGNTNYTIPRKRVKFNR